MIQNAGGTPKRSVFVVDDDEAVGFGLVMFLKASGFILLVAGFGFVGLGLV
jgi:FixJ family two-component response regulator